MLVQDLISIDVKDFEQDSLSKIKGLDVDVESFSTIIEWYDADQGNRDLTIYGEPGSGCSTLAEGLCQLLVKNKIVDTEEVLYLVVQEGCDETSLWKMMSRKARERNQKDTASYVLQEHLSKKMKVERVREFVEKNYKVICVDDADLDGNITADLVSRISPESCLKIIIHNSKKGSDLHNELRSVFPIQLKGMKEAIAIGILKDNLGSADIDEKIVSQLCCLLNRNPSALKLFGNCVNAYFRGFDSIVNELTLTEVGITNDNFISNSAVSKSLRFLFKHASDKKVIEVLHQLRKIHRPLPLLSLDARLSQLQKLTILRQEESNGISFVSMPKCFQKCLSEQQNGNHSTGEKEESFSVLNCWYSLLSDRLKQLVRDAEENAWPFVPEKWQYIQTVGKEENYNIKELITSSNSTVASLTELDVLKECLFHAYVQEEFSKLAALVFVLDRFLYWQGSEKVTLTVLDHIQRRSPHNAIAPQLLIRQARIMKNKGNLQDAEKTLDRLLMNRSEIGQWKYREAKDHHLVSGVCVQIKGDIQYTLGNLSEAVRMLVCSIELFGTLPEPDKKCQAGEIMLEFAKLAFHMEAKRQLLKVAVEDLKDSVQAHQTYASLTSKEQFYLLVCAIFKLSLAFADLQELKQGVKLKLLAMVLYEHYCSFSEEILIDGTITKVIYQCLMILQLEEYSRENLPNAGELLYRYNTARAQNRAAMGTSLTPLSLLGPNRRLVSGGYQEIVGKYDSEHRSKSGVTADVVQSTLTPEVGSAEGTTETVDQYRVTGGDKDCVTLNQDFASDEGGAESSVKTVDRSAETQDCVTQNHYQVTGSTKDCVTQNQYEAEKEDCVTVDRSASTVGLTTEPPADKSVVTQSLETEVVPLPALSRSGTLQKADVTHQLSRLDVTNMRVQDAVLWRYELSNTGQGQWRGQPTIAHVGEPLSLAKNKKGGQRNALMVQFINQDEPLARYVAKQYYEEQPIKQYQQDVLSQMTARSYVAQFNQKLFMLDRGATIGDIQFLPVALLQLFNNANEAEQVCNIEPYMSGEFTKLTNNLTFVRKDEDGNPVKGADLVLAFSHFTWQSSNGKLVIVDIQGWTPKGRGCTFLTDPQIHSAVYDCFGTGNWKQQGIDKFWSAMHPECNAICKLLGLVRPQQT
ncbi:uncharacterized protein LOC5511752 isoform X3 [Nematostella vectensis]|uniref:uncharacterized protein LOC5511752 isoform X3 n=1 Tax=Nematostella vectensis TaxID=45351 RepID=UPI00207704FE|nr:uncharacterized protein LOC5511752 isoform X3 [Nematostella vectensis]